MFNGQLFLLMCVVLLFVSILFMGASNRDYQKLKKNFESAAVQTVDTDDVANFLLDSTRFTKYHCDSKVRLCGEEQDCMTGCYNPSTFTCFNQKCVSRDSVDMGNNDPAKDEYDCNNKHNIYLVLHADGKFRCTSLYTHLYTDQDERVNYSCGNGGQIEAVETTGPNGEITVNLECKCSKGTLLVAHRDTPFIPRCYHKDVLTLPEYIA